MLEYFCIAKLNNPLSYLVISYLQTSNKLVNEPFVIVLNLFAMSELLATRTMKVHSALCLLKAIAS